MWTELYPQDRDPRREPQRQMTHDNRVINVILPCWKGDQGQARMLLDWVGEMGVVQAPFWLICTQECDVHGMIEAARKAFSVVNWIRDGEGIISNWHEAGHHPKSAAGPNSVFRQIAWTFSTPTPKGPWLFLEPDAVPCRRDWYDLISREYQVGNKPFMGYGVGPQNHIGVPPHMSGVGVYPANTPSIAPKAVDPSDTAFDIAGSDQILPKAHLTNLIFHKYRAPAFTDENDFNARVTPDLAVYHACKDGSIYPFLKKRLFGTPVSIPIPAPQPRNEGKVFSFQNGQLVA